MLGVGGLLFSCQVRGPSQHPLKEAVCIHTEALKGLENKNMQLDIGISVNRGHGLTGQFRPALTGLCLLLDQRPRRHFAILYNLFYWVFFSFLFSASDEILNFDFQFA